MRAMAWLAFVLYAVNSAILVWLHVRVRGVHPVAHAVSDYAVSGSGALFKVHGVIGCAAALALAAAVAMSQLPAFAPRIVAFLLVMALARLAVGLVATDGDGAATTAAGRVHMTAAVVVFICAGLVVVDASHILAAASPARASAWTGLKWLVVVTLAGMAATRLERWRRAFGLFERAYIASSTLWFMALAISLM